MEGAFVPQNFYMIEFAMSITCHPKEPGIFRLPVSKLYRPVTVQVERELFLFFLSK